MQASPELLLQSYQFSSPCAAGLQSSTKVLLSRQWSLAHGMLHSEHASHRVVATYIAAAQQVAGIAVERRVSRGICTGGSVLSRSRRAAHTASLECMACAQARAAGRHTRSSQKLITQARLTSTPRLPDTASAASTQGSTRSSECPGKSRLSANTCFSWQRVGHGYGTH